jgi:hypothetical protein
MPFDLYISRAESFEEIATAPAIPSEAIHRLTANMHAIRDGQHSYRIFRHENATDPWFWAEWLPEGNILLSASYTHPRFLRNYPDMFDEGLAWAHWLSVGLFEEVRQSEVTAETIDGLLAIDGSYLDGQCKAFHDALAALGRDAHGGLEFPLRVDREGDVLLIDSVSEYLLFHVAPSRRMDLTTIASMLEKVLADVAVQPFGDHAINFTEKDSGKWLAKALLRPEGVWQIWPSRQYSTFSRMAEVTIEVSERIHEATGGKVTFLGKPYQGELREEVRRRKSGLGVDFFLWTVSLGLSARRSGDNSSPSTVRRVLILDSSKSSDP